MMTRLKSFLFSLLFLLFSVWATLWLVEGVARLAFLGTIFLPQSTGEFQQQHPTRGAALPANSQLGMYQLAHAATATINSLGFRGAEVGREPAGGKTRILLVSDSNGYGSGVDDHETLAVQLQRELGDDKFEVLNFSVPAYSNVQQLIWLREEGLALKPHVVLFGFTPVNDIQTNFQPLQAVFQSASKRPYAVPDGKGGFTIDNSFMKASAEKAKKTKPLHVVRDIFAGALVQRLVDQGWERATGGRKSDPNIWIGWPYISSFSEQHGVLKVAEYEKLWSGAWEATQLVIKAMRDDAQKAGASFVMFSHVGKLEGNAEQLAGLRAAYPGLAFDIGKAERELRNFANASGIAMVSATEQVKAAEGLYFGIDDDHMNAQGYAVMAKGLAEDLRKQNLLPSK